MLQKAKINSNTNAAHTNMTFDKYVNIQTQKADTNFYKNTLVNMH